MKIKLAELVQTKNSSEEIMSIPLDVNTAWILAGNFRKIEPFLKDFEKIRIQKIKEYGEEGENGQINVKPENINKFTNELSELLEKEIDVDIKQVAMTDFKTSDGKSVDISSAILFNIYFMIKE